MNLDRSHDLAGTLPPGLEAHAYQSNHGVWPRPELIGKALSGAFRPVRTLWDQMEQLWNGSRLIGT